VPDQLTPFGYYVHVPFCARRCDYCAFATWTDRNDLIERYLRACRTDIERHADEFPAATSVFFGGGTPSLVAASLLMEVLDAIPRTNDAEVTVECNPDTVTPELFARYRAAGVTRVSLGVQSMVPHVLAALGRTHEPRNVLSAVDLARGFDTFNVDLIYGAAGESLADWERTLDEVIGLDPPHVSAYALTVEAGTPLADDVARHPDDDDQADKYALVTDRFAAAGLEWYEISNWARAGHACRHNLLYWRQGGYFGVGCAAHSHRGGRRWWNVRTPERYIDAIEDERSPEAGSEHLDDAGRALEGLQLALRTSDGVPVGALPPDAELHDLVALRGEDRAVLTVRGRLLANEVALRLRQPDTTGGNSIS
jgi:putative oxygen-independent coproporphyrinogen III oxidase